jgi:hypothetical protein
MTKPLVLGWVLATLAACGSAPRGATRGLVETENEPAKPPTATPSAVAASACPGEGLPAVAVVAVDVRYGNHCVLVERPLHEGAEGWLEVPCGRQGKASLRIEGRTLAGTMAGDAIQFAAEADVKDAPRCLRHVQEEAKGTLSTGTLAWAYQSYLSSFSSDVSGQTGEDVCPNALTCLVFATLRVRSAMGR